VSEPNPGLTHFRLCHTKKSVALRRDTPLNGVERLLGTIKMRLYCSPIAAYFLASSANGKHCLRKMVVISGILTPPLGGCVVVGNTSSYYCFYHSLLPNEAFAPTNYQCFEIRSSVSNRQLVASLAMSQLSAAGNNSNERVR
jgi:hypothetical protein